MAADESAGAVEELFDIDDEVGGARGEPLGDFDGDGSGGELREDGVAGGFGLWEDVFGREEDDVSGLELAGGPQGPGRGIGGARVAFADRGDEGGVHGESIRGRRRALLSRNCRVLCVDDGWQIS